jgi:uncharacterized protein with LGFP repeats
MGGHRSVLGLPTSGEIPLRGGAGNWFERGAIYWSPPTGAHPVWGSILEAYRAHGYETGPLGYPTTGEIALIGGAVSGFQGGYVYWSPSTGAHSVRGAILGTYLAQGAEGGRLGYPTSNEIRLPGGALSRFHGGYIYWSPGTGAHWVIGSILKAYRAQGYETGPLGYPTSNEIALPGGALSRFSGGYVYWTPKHGAHWLGGALLAAYRAQGYETGPLGYPTSDPRAVPGGTRVDFEHGTLTLPPSGPVVLGGQAAAAAPTTPGGAAARTPDGGTTGTPTTPSPAPTSSSPAPTTGPPGDPAVAAPTASGPSAGSGESLPANDAGEEQP